MLRFWSVVGSIALLGLAACGAATGTQQKQAPQVVVEAFERSLPDTEAGATLQRELGDARLTGPDKDIERDAFELLAQNEDRLVNDYISRYGGSQPRRRRP
jgi:hypothetical protein